MEATTTPVPFDWTAIIVEAMVNFFTMLLAMIVALLIVSKLK